MTKMAAKPTYDKNLQTIFLQNLYSMIIKLGMEHYELKFYTVYIDVDPELPLTYFILAISILVELVYVLIVGSDIR